MSMYNVSTCISKPEIIVNRSAISYNPETNKEELIYNIIVNYNLREFVNRQNVRAWEYEFLSYDEPIAYDNLLADLVRSRYSDEQALALLLNNDNDLESDEKKAEHKLEFQEFQQWRCMAKTIAKEAFEYAQQHNIPTK